MQPRDLAATLRRHTDAVLLADGSRRTVRYVIDRHAGTLVLPITHPEAEADELVLFVPDEGEDGAQVLLAAEIIDEGRATDRWLAYHATPDAPLWAAMTIQAARDRNGVHDGDIDLACPFATDEPALCMHANANREALSRLCASRGVRDPAPVLVGVDDLGFDVRARTGIVRFDFDDPAPTAGHARERIDRDLAAAEGAR